MSLWKAIFGKPTAQPETEPAKSGRVDLGRITLSERGDVVGYDFQDDMRGEKIADNVGATLLIRYATPGGSPLDRLVVVDGVYGPSLDAPDYIRGVDSRTGEARTFRVDRIEALIRDDLPPLTEDIAWWIGAACREAAGVPLTSRPRTWAVQRPVELSVASYGRDPVDYQGQITGAALRYREGPMVVLAFDGAPKRGGSRATKFEAAIGAAHRRQITRLTDAVTNEPVEEIISWLDGLDASPKP